MMAHPYDDIEAFALGGLDEVSGRRILAHADQCPTCATLLAEAMSAAAALETPGERPLATPIPMGAIASPTLNARKRPTLIFGWASSFAAAAAIVGLLVWNVDLRSNMPTVPIGALVHSHFTHHALHGAAGDAKVIQAVDGHWVYVVADGLQPRSTYRLWEDEGGAQRVVGSFGTDAAGRATGYWEQAPAKLSGFAVTPADAGTQSSSALRWP